MQPGVRTDATIGSQHRGVKVPTLMAQLRRDFLIKGEKDGQEIFDSLAAQTKELLWIDQSNQRFYAYNHFGQHPDRLIGWFNRYMSGNETERASEQKSAAHAAL